MCRWNCAGASDGVWDIRFNERFAIEFPKIAKDGPDEESYVRALQSRLTWRPWSSLPFGHELDRRLVARVRSKEFERTRWHTLIVTSDVEPTDGWFFTYELEFEEW